MGTTDYYRGYCEGGCIRDAIGDHFRGHCEGGYIRDFIGDYYSGFLNGVHISDLLLERGPQFLCLGFRVLGAIVQTPSILLTSP